jgi:hypothetical protein
MDMIDSAASVWSVASEVIALAAIVAAALPKPKEGTALYWARSLLDLLAVNIANAKNAKPRGGIGG